MQECLTAYLPKCSRQLDFFSTNLRECSLRDNLHLRSRQINPAQVTATVEAIFSQRLQTFRKNNFLYRISRKRIGRNFFNSFRKNDFIECRTGKGCRTDNLRFRRYSVSLSLLLKDLRQHAVNYHVIDNLHHKRSLLLLQRNCHRQLLYSLFRRKSGKIFRRNLQLLPFSVTIYSFHNQAIQTDRICGAKQISCPNRRSYDLYTRKDRGLVRR